MRCWATYLFYCLVIILSILSACERKEVPSLVTTEITEITDTSATSGGKIVSDGGAPIITSGICWDTSGEPTVADNTTSDAQIDGSFISNLTGLKGATSYCVRAYATNSEGTGYGNPVYFRTTPTAPLALITGVNSITGSSAIVNGFLVYGNGIVILSVGIYYSTSENPTIEDSFIEATVDSTHFILKLSGLMEITKYYIRSYVIFRIYGTSQYYVIYGNEVSFITKGIPPNVITENVFSVLAETANVVGNVTYDGGAKILNRGVCVDTVDIPTISDMVYYCEGELGIFTANITNLKPNTAYYARAFAENSEGISYGETRMFVTSTGTIIDASGQIYPTKQIGTQLWLAKNLQTTKFNDNTDIQQWTLLSSPAYCWCENKENHPYGILYNWYTVNTEKLCPISWHVPSLNEWTVLFDFLGGKSVAGIKLKDINIGFNALPGGKRDASNSTPYFSYVDMIGFWWTSSTTPSGGAIYWNLGFTAWSYRGIWIQNDVSKNIGISVRCIKD